MGYFEMLGLSTFNLSSDQGVGSGAIMSYVGGQEGADSVNVLKRVFSGKTK